MLLWRSTTRRRNAILDDSFIFLKEHEKNDNMIEDDSMNFCEAIQYSMRRQKKKVEELHVYTYGLRDILFRDERH